MNLINTVIFLSVTVVFKVLGVQVCGKALADMLDLVCDGRGFHWINPDGKQTFIRFDEMKKKRRRSLSVFW